MVWRSVRIACVALLAGLGSSRTWADESIIEGGTSTVTVESEYQKRIQGAEDIKPLGTDLLGDQISLYNGALSFAAMDASIPGNSKLAVSVGRTFQVGAQRNGDGLFGDWDLDIPHLEGVYASQPGWIVTDPTSPNRFNRCSAFDAPPAAQGSTANLGVFVPYEFWHGVHLSVPGTGRQELLLNQSGWQPTNALGPYPLVTTGRWVFRCLSATASGEPGEAFVGLAPDGTEYRFDWLVSRTESNVFKSYAETSTLRPDGIRTPVPGSYSLSRREYWMLPTQAKDRFGNTVQYTYDTTPTGDKWRLTQISDGDGRQLSLTYVPGTRRVETVSDGTRVWRYTYASGSLTEVQLPDASKWKYSLLGLNNANLTYSASNPQTCTHNGPSGTYRAGTFAAPLSLSGTVTHPSGAVGTFVVEPRHHSRSYMPARAGNCVVYDTNIVNPRGFEHNPEIFDTWAITSKSLTGPGLPATGWTYVYSEPQNSAVGDACGSSCPSTKTVTVTDLEGIVRIHSFGTKYQETEGHQLQVEVWDGPDLLRTEKYRHRLPVGTVPYPNPVGQSFQESGDTYMATRLFPQDQRQILQQDETFTWSATAFDAYGEPTSVTRSSTLGFSRTETTVYYHDTIRWVLAQVASVTDAGVAVLQNFYDPNTASLTSTRTFGQPATTMTYYPNGLLWTKADGALQTTTYSDYHRGIAKHVALPDGNSFDVTVDNLGQIRSMTNAAGSTTSYEYDPGGRLSRVRYPTLDSTSWVDTTLTFVPVLTAEYGLPAGHWKQTVQTGSGISEKYFDALWRPAMTRAYDSTYTLPNGTNATERQTVRRFDSEGRETFVSYPGRGIASVGASLFGSTTHYDGLGRATQVLADWENPGQLETKIEYLGDFTKRITNARLKTTTTTFQAFDEPDESAPMSISAPLGTDTLFTRDRFGKPLTMKRRGFYAGNPVEATRTYVYDSAQRLCKTIEPESGAQIVDYNAAGMAAWRATGQTFLSTSDCQRGSVPPAQKESYSYDPLNRLLNTTYTDGTLPVERTYTEDGLLKTIKSDGATWTTLYNKRRLPTTETLDFDGGTYNIGYTYTSVGRVAGMSYPDGSTIDYAPNALGEATKVGTYASGIKVHPNGGLAEFRYGNNVLHTTAQNTRGYPSRSTDGAMLDDEYRFDQNANVTDIIDHTAGQTYTRSMVYDDLDRLTSATNLGIWGGTATMEYDGLDNIRRNATPSLDFTLQYNASQRLTQLALAATPTSPLITYGYDDSGRVTSRFVPGASQSFTVDRAGRLNRIAVGANTVAAYRYDGHGRRTRITKGTDNTLQIYTQAGQLIYQVGSGTSDGIFRSGFQSNDVPYPPATGGTKRFVYLGRHLLAEDGTAGRAYLYTDALGSPVVKVGATVDRTYYFPYGLVKSGGGPGPGFTGHVSDPETGLNYMQARYFDPYPGRFLSPDPKPADGASFNRYWYGLNNPFKAIDPDGRENFCWLIGGSDICGTKKPTEEEWTKFKQASGDTAMIVVPGAGLAGCLSGGCATALSWAGAAADAVPVGKMLSSLGKMGSKLFKFGEKAAGKASLEERVATVHGALDSIASEMRVTAVMEVKDGTRFVGSGGRDLDPAQRALLEPGEVATKLPGAHAEVTLIRHVLGVGLSPAVIATSKAICPACIKAIEETGGRLISETKAVWD
jgi:RHS repeat-associated protein